MSRRGHRSHGIYHQQQVSWRARNNQQYIYIWWKATHKRIQNERKQRDIHEAAAATATRHLINTHTHTYIYIGGWWVFAWMDFCNVLPVVAEKLIKTVHSCVCTVCYSSFLPIVFILFSLRSIFIMNGIRWFFTLLKFAFVCYFVFELVLFVGRFIFL